MLKITICDETWTIRLVDTLVGLPACEDDPRGITFVDSKDIYYKKSELTKGLVRHELFHAHHYYLFMCNTVSRDDREETLALWLEHRGELFNAQVERVYAHLRRSK